MISKELIKALPPPAELVLVEFIDGKAVPLTKLPFLLPLLAQNKAQIRRVSLFVPPLRINRIYILKYKGKLTFQCKE